MPDRVQNTSCWKFLLWTAVAFLAIFPLFTVNSTSWGMRTIWISFVLMMVFVGLMAHLRTKSDPELERYAELQRNGPYVRRYRSLAFGVILITLLVAEILAVAATYATPDRPILWHGTELIAHWGEAIFPLVGKYATQMTPPLEPAVLFKVQAAATLFLSAGAVFFITFAPYFFCMPYDERQIQQRVQESASPSRFTSSISKLLVLLPIAILMGCAVFFGWFEFDSDAADLSRKKCLIEAACYSQDDLMLIAAGFLRIFGSYGFWLGGMIGAIQAFDAQTE